MDGVESEDTAFGTANCFNSAASPFFYAGGTLCSTLPAASRVPTAAFNPLFPTLNVPLNQVFVLRDRPSKVNVVVTGRDASDELCEIADTVTEMREVKHA